MRCNAPALEKGLLILEYVLEVQEPVTLSRIAESVGFKVSEIQRMVGSLAKDGFLVKTASGAYAPGARSYALADRKLDSAVIARSEGPMKRYAARTGASVHLSLFVENKLHVVYDVEGPGDVRVVVRPGLYDAEETPSGRLFLAYCAAGGQADTGEYAALRREGLAFGELACTVGLYVLSVPVAIGSNPCAATVASPYFLKSRGDPLLRSDLTEELRRCSAEITAQF